MEELIGTIKLFAGNFAPHGWLICDGRLLNITQNAALFSIIGTTRLKIFKLNQFSGKSIEMHFPKVTHNTKTMQWLLFTIACFLYINTVPNKWAVDDSIIIHQNKLVQHSYRTTRAQRTDEVILSRGSVNQNIKPKRHQETPIMMPLKKNDIKNEKSIQSLLKIASTD